MRDRLAHLLESADLAIASCAGVVGDSLLEPLIESVRRVRVRLAYPEDVLVVALAGGTGSGKSSVFNVIAGEELVDVGGVRPTTSNPAAALPADVGPSLEGYLDVMGVAERHSVSLDGLCLIDLPDTDSVELGHRYQVDAILPLLDIVVWVTDPEKYHDARLHHEYLRPLARYSDQFVFVLNQVDRLSDDEAAEVATDLEVALASDGIEAPEVVSVAAAPSAGPPIGLEGLLDALEQKRTAGSALYGKLVADLATTTAALEAAVGSGLEFDERASRALEAATKDIVSSEIDSATAGLAAFADEVAGDAGGLTGEKILRLAADIPRHVSRIASGTEPDATRRWLRRRAALSRDPEAVGSMLNEAVIRPIRAVLAKRALARAAVTELAIELQRLS
jgi:hypothetical protein